MSLRETGSVLHPVPLQQCALVSNIAGNACNTMKQRGALRLGDTAPCFMKQCCIVWTDLCTVDAGWPFCLQRDPASVFVRLLQ